MRKVFLLALVLVILFLFSAGCATRDYVRQQMEPLVERISRLETQCSSRGSSQDEEARKDAAEAKILAQEAMKTAKDCCGKADAAADRAEAAANRAEAAAKKAGAAAETSKKAFELQQMK
jgi:membrane protein involved in colicin uptake